MLKVRFAEREGTFRTELRDSGDVDGAREVWQQALAIFEQLDDPQGDEIRAELDALPD